MADQNKKETNSSKKAKHITSKQIIPIVLALVAGAFAYVGFAQLGFWDPANGPQSGFFPSIIAIVMLIMSLIVFATSLKDHSKAEYHKDEFIIIGAVLILIIASYIIGLVPAILVFLLLWTKAYEKMSWKTTFVIIVICAVIVLGVFGWWLDIQFPWGLFEYLM